MHDLISIRSDFDIEQHERDDDLRSGQSRVESVWKSDVARSPLSASLSNNRKQPLNTVRNAGQEDEKSPPLPRVSNLIQRGSIEISPLLHPFQATKRHIEKGIYRLKGAFVTLPLSDFSQEKQSR